MHRRGREEHKQDADDAGRHLLLEEKLGGRLAYASKPMERICEDRGAQTK